MPSSKRDDKAHWYWWCWKCNYTVSFDERKANDNVTAIAKGGSSCPACNAGPGALVPKNMKAGDVVMYDEVEND